MQAGDIMSRPVLATTPKASVRDVAAQLLMTGFSGMPVAERDGTVVGVLSEADIIGLLVEGKELASITVREIMSHEPVTVDVEASIDEVLKLLVDHLRIPVTDRGSLVGVIARSDAIRAELEPEFMTF